MSLQLDNKTTFHVKLRTFKLGQTKFSALKKQIFQLQAPKSAVKKAQQFESIKGALTTVITSLIHNASSALY